MTAERTGVEPHCLLVDGHIVWVHECDNGPDLEPDMLDYRHEVISARLPTSAEGWTATVNDAGQLTVSPSIDCHGCALHGNWINDEWKPAAATPAALASIEARTKRRAAER